MSERDIERPQPTPPPGPTNHNSPRRANEASTTSSSATRIRSQQSSNATSTAHRGDTARDCNPRPGDHPEPDGRDILAWLAPVDGWRAQRTTRMRRRDRHHGVRWLAYQCEPSLCAILSVVTPAESQQRASDLGGFAWAVDPACTAIPIAATTLRPAGRHRFRLGVQRGPRRWNGDEGLPGCRLLRCATTPARRRSQGHPHQRPRST